MSIIYHHIQYFLKLRKAGLARHIHPVSSDLLIRIIKQYHLSDSTCFYQLLQFDAEPSVIAKLEVNYRRDERVMRFLTFKLDKYAYEYAEKRRSLKSNQEKEN